MVSVSLLTCIPFSSVHCWVKEGFCCTLEVKGTNKVTLLQMGMWYLASHVETLSWHDLPWAVGSLNAVLGGVLPFTPEEMASSPLSLLSQSL